MIGHSLMTKITLADGELRQFRFACDTTPILVFPIPLDAPAFRAVLRNLLTSEHLAISLDDMAVTKTDLAVSVVTRQGKFPIPWQDAARIAFTNIDATA